MWTGYEIDPELALWRNAFLIAQLGALIAQPSGPFSTALSPLRSYFYRGRNAWPIRRGPTASGTLKYPPSVTGCSSSLGKATFARHTPGMPGERDHHRYCFDEVLA